MTIQKYMNTKSIVGIVLGCAILVGGGYIVYADRPVMKLPQPQAEQKTVSQEQQSDSAQPSSNQAEKSAAYSLADVSTHAVPENCWSVVSGNVYDLTSWVARHPGGENPIKRMCGIDATSSFERKHGNSQNAKAALVLLKIGALK